jgi:hypothetical protein
LTGDGGGFDFGGLLLLGGDIFLGGGLPFGGDFNDTASATDKRPECAVHTKTQIVKK